MMSLQIKPSMRRRRRNFPSIRKCVKKTLTFTPEIYDYLLQHSLREPSVLARLRKTTSENYPTVSQMQICPEQGQLMQLLVEMLGAKKTLDVGTFTGYSALSVALALPEDGKVIACDINPEWTALAKLYWEEAGVRKKIDLILGPASETLASLIKEGQGGSFDFAFIDANKTSYPEYYELCLTLLRHGGVMAIDNVLLRGKVVDQSNNENSTQIMRKLNKKILDDDRVSISILPISDGMTLARKK